MDLIKTGEGLTDNHNKLSFIIDNTEPSEVTRVEVLSSLVS